MRRNVKLRNNGRPVVIDQRQAARQRIRRWAEAGYSIGVIAQMTGVRKATLAPHMDGTRVAISHSTASRVMAAKGMPDSGGFVSSTGTWRRLRALTVMGWSMSDLASQCDIPESTLHALRDPQHRFTRPKYAATVSELYERLSMTRGGCKYASVRAIRKGWLPPLAWDDIDDPNESPTLTDDPKDRAEVIAQLEWIIDSDHPTRIAKRLGYERPESLIRSLARWGRHDLASRLERAS
jgi:AraC-like DNA-binding protein